MRNRVVAALLTLCSAAVLESQSRPLVAPAAAAIYARLLPQIETIKLFDHHAHPAFAELRTITFHHADNENIIVYSKTTPPTADGTAADVMLCVVNLDPYNWHEATLSLDLSELGVAPGSPFVVHDELSGESYTWNDHPYVRIDPARQPGHIFAIRIN